MKHKFKLIYMYWRQVNGRDHRTHKSYDSTLIALPLSYPQVQFFYFSIFKKWDGHKSELNKDIFSKHKLKPMYMYKRLVSGGGRRTHHPYDSALNALPLSYSLVFYIMKVYAS